ncbi:MAG TPA: DUF3710 domain-containing protein [Actinomycetaceae bacterium]|nr:DUF3710 domain-containing protein [Actinomycetaceae bacterium]
MALFSRRRQPEPEVQEEAEPLTSGPWDIEDEAGLGNRVDLGALRIPKRPGMSLRLELERASRVPVAATVTLGESTVQMQVLAAPRTMSLWDQVRPELAESVRSSGGEVDEVPGEFGRELLARMPVTTPGGSGVRPMRLVGIDGPRWMIRATFTGKAAFDIQAAKELEDVLRDAVVVRGTQARPPREVLPLTVPGQTQQDDAGAPETDALGMPRRGPEMTETR